MLGCVGEALGRCWVGVREVSGRCRGDVEEVCRVGSRRSGWDACVGRAWGVRGVCVFGN